MQTKNIAVARLWHKKGKYEYFGLRQLVTAFPDISFDFHIVLDPCRLLHNLPHYVF